MKKLFYLILIFITLSTSLKGRTIDEIKKSGKIYAAFTEGSLNSVNYKFALEFAKFLNVELVIISTTWEENFSKNGKIPNNYQTNPNISYNPDALKKADFICGSIYMLEWRKKFFEFAGILDLSDLLVIPQKARNLKSYDDLKGLKIAFLENSVYESNIKSINQRIGGGIKFEKTQSEEASVKLLKQGKVDGYITVAYNALETVKNDKNFKLAFPVAPIKKSGWAVRKGNKGLLNEINNFFETIRGNGKLDELFVSQYGINYKAYLEILNSYSQTENINTNQRDLDEILASGKITIALRDRLMVYNKKEKQFNTYLAEEFAYYLGVELDIKYTPYFAKYFENKNGELLKDSAYTPEWFNYIDVAAEIMVPLKWRLKKLNIIPFIPFAQVVIGRKNMDISSLNDLKKYKGVTSKGSAQEDILINNNINNYYYAKGNDFLIDISKGKADYAIGTDAVYRIKNFKNLEAKFVIGQVGLDGWAIKKNQPKLKRKILEFLEHAKKEGIIDKYFRQQTGMSLRATKNYLTVLQETYQPGVFPFVSYGSKEGLPQEDILAIYQDKDNYIWFGTHSGAVKYNGREMNVFNKAKGLASNSIYDIAQDIEGSIFFATLKGASIYENGKITNLFPKFSFRKVYIDFKNNKWFFGDNGIAIYGFDRTEKLLNKENLNLPTKVYSIYRAKDGKTYIGSKSGLFLFDNEYKVTQISEEPTYNVFVDEENQLWVSTINGVYVINLNNPTSEIKLNNKINEQLNLPKNTIIKTITQTKDGTIWFISNSKIFQIITLQQKPIVYDENIGLDKQQILSFLEDKEENLWIGYAGGIQKLTNKSLRLLYPKTIRSYINSIVEDKYNRIWIGQNTDVHVLKGKLVNFTESFTKDNKSYLVSKLSNNNIIIASTLGIYEIDVEKLKIKKKNIFKNPLHFLDNIYVSKNDEIFLLTGENGIIYYFKNPKAKPIALSNLSTSLVMQLSEFEDMIVGGNKTGLVYFNGNDFYPLINIGDDVIWSVCPDKDKLWVGTERGLGYYKDDEYTKLNINLSNNVINAIKVVDDTYLWIGTNGGFFYFNKKTKKTELSIDAKDGLQGNEIAINGLFLDEKGLLWIGTYHGISTFDIKKNKPVKYTPEGKIEKILLNGKEISLSKLLNGLKHFENNIIFEITGLSFKDEKSIEYDFFMKGLENDYSASKGHIYKAQYTNLPPGKYQFNYRTKGNDGIWSYYKQIEFVIYKPIWATWWFRILSVILSAFIILGLIKWRGHALEQKNEELERIVNIRTAQVVEKNEELQQQTEEILTQRDKIEKQRDTAEKQRDEITVQKKEMTDSILYASRIQNALLPPKKYIKESLTNHFILYLPRDIVSGDYYWMYRKQNKAIIVAADCTGHGVPGAFMSMLGSAFLSEITAKSNEIPDANEILNQLRELVISTLHQTGGENETKDGMDVALCVIDFDNNTVNYSGAFNSLYLIRNNELNEYKADRMPIGVSYNQDKSFTNHFIEFEKDDVFYIFSDGFIDQFGGPRGKKFKSRPFKSLLMNIQDKSMDEQKKILHTHLLEWRGNIEQIDDILVIGFKL